MDLVKKAKFIFPLVIMIMFVFSCDLDTRKIKDDLLSNKVEIDLKEIKKRGKLVAVTDYNSINYFVYRGQPMGYQFELLKRLAEYLDVKLEIVVNNNIDECFKGLLDGEYDLIANNLTITKERKRIVAFTEPYLQSRQVLVQRKPDNRKVVIDDDRYVRNQLDIGGKMVYVQKGSVYSRRLHNLSEEIGDTISIFEIPTEVEELIELVASGEIDYTVSDENVAKVNQTYYPNLDIKTAVSFPQNIAWALRKESPELQQEINKWIVNYKTTYSYNRLYSRYFANKKAATRFNSDYYAISSGKISDYDHYIKKYSEELGWDWRLLASLIFQESRFQPRVKSWAGAFGLMQLMPVTAKRFGVHVNSKPEEHIEAGVDFIKWLYDRFEKENLDEEEKLKFILASYNVGYGHIKDARKLAKKFGKDPDKWDGNVDYYLLNKSKPKFYRDPVVKYGYCRGKEPYNYVYSILERYEHYKNIVNN